MSLLELDLSDAKEPTTLEAGREYRIRIMSARTDNDKNGDPYMIVVFEAPEEEASKAFSHFFRIPHEGQTPKQRNQAKWDLVEFLRAFGKDPGRPFDPDELTGLEGWAILGIRDTEDYGEQNVIKKFIAPK